MCVCLPSFVPRCDIQEKRNTCSVPFLYVLLSTSVLNSLTFAWSTSFSKPFQASSSTNSLFVVHVAIGTSLKSFSVVLFLHLSIAITSFQTGSFLLSLCFYTCFSCTYISSTDNPFFSIFCAPRLSYLASPHLLLQQFFFPLCPSASILGMCCITLALED